MASPREAIIEASAKIAQLRSELSRVKAELREQESELDRLLNGAPSIREMLTSKVAERLTEASLNQRIVDLLDGHSIVPFDAEAVSEALPGTNVASIRSALPRLADQHKIRRSERGKYQSMKSQESASAEIQLDSTASPNGTIALEYQPTLYGNPGSLTSRLLGLLLNAPPSGLTAEQIFDRHGVTANMDSLRSALARLASEGRIERVSRGAYRGKELKAM